MASKWVGKSQPSQQITYINFAYDLNLYIFVIYFVIVMSLILREFCCYNPCVFHHKTMIIFARQYMEFIFDW